MSKQFSPLGGNTAYVCGVISPLFTPNPYDRDGNKKVKEVIRATKQGNIRISKEVSQCKKARKIEKRKAPIGARGLVVIGDILKPHPTLRKVKEVKVAPNVATSMPDFGNDRFTTNVTFARP